MRENQDGILKTLVYGRLIAAGDDPIEKKPIFHLMPGSRSFSIATVGCNFKCRFCQNADIAQMPADRDGMVTGDPTTPEQVVAAARNRNCASIAYTYTEQPPVGLELHPNVAVWLCHMFPSCDSHPIATCRLNADYCRRALAWS